jgi:hypothetical protein
VWTGFRTRGPALPFQQKIGAACTREQFQRKVDDGEGAARGASAESMIGEALGWKLDRMTDELQPKMAAEGPASS